MRKYFEQLQTPILILDENGLIRYANPSFKEKVFQLDKLRKRFLDLFTIDNPDVFLSFLDLGNAQGKREFEVKLEKDHSVFDYEISVTHFTNPDKIVLEFNEISEFKQVRKDLVKKTTILQNLREYMEGSNHLETTQNYMKRSLNFLLQNLDFEKGYLHFETEIVAGSTRFSAEGKGMDKEVYSQLVNKHFFGRSESNIPTLVSKVLRNVPHLDPEFENKYMIKKQFGQSSLYFVFEPGRTYGFEDSFDVNILVSILIHRLIWTDLRIKDLKMYNQYVQ
ncbi:PAS domain-containing protein [Cecembia calidifontis]|jgi:hypothetical protein|uniref:PAS domain-containing protein n=1 Tax=Cecembia calidifontis TaxID=1187080 RepID=A0A4Q7PH63_9BACT|nr:PAS domain-containing protein [Cecembia calidifontis]RZS98242.1 PAS domain-containing protein [Cecembia calidifontis]